MLARLFGLKPKPETDKRARIDPTLGFNAAPRAEHASAQDAPLKFSEAPQEGGDPQALGALPASIPLQEVALKAVPHRGPKHKHMEVPAYPTHGAAVPAAPPELLLETQRPLIRRLHLASLLSREEFDDYILPAIANFAAFVHLLPASESNHHSQVGGLFRHSLEVAYHAAIKCTSQVFALSQTPMYRKEQEPRWRACAVLAGLLHDIGKVIIDIGAKDETGKIIWEPNTLSLYDWLVQSKLDYYFIYWRPGKRGVRHESFSMSMVRTIIPTATNVWLNEFGGRTAVIEMMSALAGDTSPTNQIFKVVDRAEQISVRADIAAATERDAGIGDGGRRGISARIIRTIHSLLDTGEWLLNEPTHAMWWTTEGLFAVFPTVAERIIEAMRSSGDTSVPPDADAIVDYLDQARQLAPNVLPGGQFHCTWKARIYPAEQDAQTEFPSLTYVRFMRDQTIIPHRIVRPKPAFVEILDDNNVVIGGSRPPWALKPAKSQADAPPPRAPAAPTAEPDETALADTPPPAPLRDRHSEISPRMEKLASAQTAMTSKWPPLTPEEAAAWLDNEGTEGQLLKAVADRVHAQRLAMGADVIELERCVNLRYPEAFVDLGIEEKQIVQMIEHKGWLQRDPPNAARATVTLPVQKGKPITAIRLNENISQAYALLLPRGLVAERRSPAPSDAPAPLTTTTARSKPAPQAKALGKYIDADVAARLRSLQKHDAHDGHYIRRAYWTYLQDLRDAGELDDAPTPKRLYELAKNFARQHRGITSDYLFLHITEMGRQIYLNQDKNHDYGRAQWAIDVTYNPDLEDTQVVP
jgi:hypothetical protein